MGPCQSKSKKSKLKPNPILHSIPIQASFPTSSLPQTSEETLTFLITLFDEKCRDQKILEDKFKLLKAQLGEEKVFDDHLKFTRLLEEIKMKFSEDQSRVDLQNLLKRVQVFNMKRIEEILVHVKKAEDEIDSIRDKDVVLFLGHTGSGKSTILLYLCGCEMIKYKENYDAANKINFPHLKNIFANHSQNQSGTEFSAFAGLKNQLFAGDCPGFNDTKGEEQEIANYLNVNEVISVCKSLKFVLIVDNAVFGMQSNGLKQLARDLQKCFPNFERYLGYFLVLFNKFEKTKKKENLDLRFEQIIKTSDDVDIKGYKSLLVHMHEASKKNGRIIDFRKDQRSHILTEIVNLPALSNFQEDLSSNVRRQFDRKIFEFNEKHRNLFNLGIKKKNYAIFKPILDRLFSIAIFFKGEKEKNNYVDFCQGTSTIFKEVLIEKIKNLKSIIEQQKYIDKSHLIFIDDTVDLINLVEDCQKTHLSSPEFDLDIESLVKLPINDIVREILRNYRIADVLDPKFNHFSASIDLLIKKFQLGKDLVEDYEKISIMKAENLVNFIANSNFSNERMIFMAEEYKRIAAEKKEIKIFTTIYNEISERLKKKLESLADLGFIKAIFKEENNNSDISKDANFLNESLEFLNLCKKSENPDLDVNQVKNIFDEYQKELSLYFENLYTNLSNTYELVSKSTKTNLFTVFDILRRLSRNIEFVFCDDLNNHLNNFSEVKGRIQNIIEKIFRVMKDSFSNQIMKNEKLNIDLIKDALIFSKKTWLAKSIQPNSNFGPEIEKIVNEIVHPLIQNFLLSNIDPELSVSNEKTTQFYQYLNDLNLLVNHLDGLKEFIEKASEEFASKLKDALNKIFKSLEFLHENPEKVDPKTLEGYLNFAEQLTLIGKESSRTANDCYERLKFFIKNEFKSNIELKINALIRKCGEDLSPESVFELSHFFKNLKSFEEHKKFYDNLFELEKDRILSCANRLSKDLAKLFKNEESMKKIKPSVFIGLRQIDEIAGTDNFAIYEKKYKLPEQEKEVYKNIDAFDYEPIFSIKIDYKMDGVMSRIKEYFQSHCSLLSLKENKNVIQIEAEDFLKNLETLHKLFMFFKNENCPREIQNLSSIVLNTIKGNTNLVTANISTQAETTKKKLTSNDFIFFEKIVDYLNQMKRIVDSLSKKKDLDLFLRELNQKLNDISDKLIDFRNSHLKELTTFYEKTSSFKNFKEKPPKQLIENMDATNNTFYSAKIEELKLIIQKTLDNLMLKLSHQVRDLNDFDTYFFELEAIYEDLIDYHVLHIKNEKETLKSNKKKEIEKIIPEFQSVISSKDLSRIIKFLNEKVPNYQVLEPNLIEYFRKEIQNYQLEINNMNVEVLERCVKCLELINRDLLVCRKELEPCYKAFSSFISLKIKNMTKNMLILFDYEKKYVDVSNCKTDLILFFQANTLFDSSQNKGLIWEDYGDTLVECIDELNTKWGLQKAFLSQKVEHEEFTEIVPLLRIYQTNGLIIDSLKNPQTIANLESCTFYKLKYFADCLKNNLTKFDDIKTCIQQNFLTKIEKLKNEDLLSNMNSEMYKNRFIILKEFQTKIEDLEKSMPKFGDLVSSQLKTTIDEKISTINKRVKAESKNFELNIFSSNLSIGKFSQALECLQNFQNYFCCDEVEGDFEEHIKLLNTLSIKIKGQMLLVLGEEEKLIEALKNVKSIAISISAVSQAFNSVIDELLFTYKENLKKNQTGGVSLIKFIEKLKKDRLGNFILEQHALFEDCKNLLYNLKFPRKKIEVVLQDQRLRTDGYRIDHDKLKNIYHGFEDRNKKLIDRYITDNQLYDPIVKDLLELVEGLKKNGTFFKKNVLDIFKSDSFVWHDEVIEAIPNVLASLFAIYTLMNSKASREIEEENIRNQYLFLPHCSQVISILMMLGCNIEGGENFGLQNNFIQIGTGEGKSITLAVLSIFLSLFGFNVYCSNYSKNLSDRDFQSFKPLFDILGVTEFIHYSTFNKLCEKILNENGDIRELVEKRLLNENIAAKNSLNKTKRPKILLIDELDVFFSSQFYGRTYSPCSSIKIKDHLDALIKYIWENRGSVKLGTMRNEVSYINCKAALGECSSLLESAVKQMIFDVKNFKNHGYIVNEGKIGYKEQDGIEYDINIGYKTLFAYLHEIEVSGNISSNCKKFQKFKRLILKCGDFSYATLIKDKFSFIMGVTGTLETLNEEMKKDLRDTYNVKKFSYMPSVYPESKFVFDPDKNIWISTEEEYFNSIAEEIDRVKKTEEGNKRPIIIVFENLRTLKDFYDFEGFKKFKSNSDCLTEETNESKIKKIIDEATKSGNITLMTKSFGRGTDFVIRDEILIKSGGVHVIQSFYSTSKSEEIQIKGRTARQGDPGSYSLLMMDNTFALFGLKKEDLLNKSKATLLSDLEKQREIFNEKEHLENQKSVRKAGEKHLNSMKFLDSLIKGDKSQIKTFLEKENEYKASEKMFKTLILMDGTVSMKNLLENAKKNVSKMFEQSYQILKNKGYPEGYLFIKFAAYRNYNSEEKDLLEHSAWENSPENLENFLKSIYCSGGYGNEAIEIGLWYANQEEELNQIILIGDAGCNSEKEVQTKRAIKTEPYWTHTKFANKTYYETELKTIKEKQIKINAFYLHQRAKVDFEKVASYCNGTASFLDINQNDEISCKVLTDSVTMEILRAINPNLAEDYKRAYMK